MSRSKQRSEGSPVEPKSSTPKPLSLKVDQLIPYARNARKHSDEQVTQIAASIREFGFKVPIVVDQDCTVRAGHGRLLAAKKLGMAEVPCLQYSDLSDTQWRAFVLADNQIALNATWDEEVKRIEIDDLLSHDFDVKQIGFDDSAVFEPDLPDENEGLQDGEENKFTLTVTLQNKADQEDLFDRLKKMGYSRVKAN